MRNEKTGEKQANVSAHVSMKAAIAILLVFLAATPALSQTVTKQAEQEIAADKQKRRLDEAKELLHEKAKIAARVAEIEKRLGELDKGAEPRAKTDGQWITSGTWSSGWTGSVTCCDWRNCAAC